MSIYSDCVEAAQQILRNPDLTTRAHLGLFTELDVIALAAKNAGGYSEAEYRQALTEANLALTKMFGRFEVARFGPTRPPGARIPDYVRLATKIVYADPEGGPRVIETPNGRFKRLMVWQDKHKRAGRRLSTNRDDFQPWSEQDFANGDLKRVAA